jgi:ribonuclease HI
VLWIKGHTDVKGNEKVDKEAKVAKGKMGKVYDLP